MRKMYLVFFVYKNVDHVQLVVQLLDCNYIIRYERVVYNYSDILI